jgi:hypothetical protein
MIRNFAETGSHGCKESIRIQVLAQRDFIVANEPLAKLQEEDFNLICWNN